MRSSFCPTKSPVETKSKVSFKTDLAVTHFTSPPEFLNAQHLPERFESKYLWIFTPPSHQGQVSTWYTNKSQCLLREPFPLRPAERPKREEVNATRDGSLGPQEAEFGSWIDYISKELETWITLTKIVNRGKVKGCLQF